ncbi:MAG: sigma 54-interacting transcriptional regulator [Prevotella sp.]|nr:sigma 54-interacting transcriptional regulator [Prevotella sp.]
MENRRLQEVKNRYQIVGNSEALNHALDIALQVASTNLSVLIVGESGVGKEIIPRVIHDNSSRRREKFFAINCGAIPEGTIDSELFGHEKGSFTGAIGESEGYFGVANKGTIFLDEVGELPLSTQTRLLRVLERGEYIRVGGQEIRKTDVRIVAATNVNMRKAISEGRFREDLFYRLNTIPIAMPALRERGTDILLLFRLFALQMQEQYHIPKITLTKDAEALMLKYKWPGNVRQLKNITEQMSVLSRERVITADILRTFIPDDPETTELATIAKAGPHSYENEREMLLQVLYELRTNVGDLRREVNGLRHQIDDAKNLSSAAQTISANLPAKLDDINDNIEKPKNPQVEEAEAEEISELENLNLKDLGRQQLKKALERNGGNRRKAARELGISERTLYRRLQEFGLSLLIALFTLSSFSSCKVSYSLSGASVDYSKTKTIQIADFPIRSSYVWGPMQSIFNNTLRDLFTSRTRLEEVRRNGDLVLEGEITQYQQRNKGVSSEGYSAQVELSMTVNVRFTNNVNHDEDFEQQFTATATYPSTQSLNSVQEELVTQMVEDITQQIYNATLANW